jgi:hypothetical protein
MRLPGMIGLEAFHRLVKALLAAPSTLPTTVNGHEERRNSARLSCCAEVSVVLVGTGDKSPAQAGVHYLSLGGIAILSDRPISPGERFIVVVGGTAARQAFLCATVHCRPQVGRGYLWGASFVRELISAAQSVQPQPSAGAVEDNFVGAEFLAPEVADTTQLGDKSSRP